MQNQLYELKFLKTYKAFIKLEENKPNTERALKCFIEACNDLVSLIEAHNGDYKIVYDFYLNGKAKNTSIIMDFFKEVRDISSDAYEFMCEGRDVLNLKDYFWYCHENGKDVLKEAYRIKEWTLFIKHSIIKMLNEPSIERRQIILRGLIGF